jgi:UPF0716 protein FxsA
MWFGAFLIFVAVPLLELALLIKVGQSIGFWSTVAVIVLTAALGIAVMQSHGLKTMQRAQASLAEGKPPVESVVDGTFVMFAGLLLISPGLITDLLGLLLLVPPVRRLISGWSMGRLLASGKVQTWTYSSSTRTTPDGQSTRQEGARFERPAAGDAEQPSKRWESKPGPRPARGAGKVIDGEFERIDEKTIQPQGPKDRS